MSKFVINVHSNEGTVYVYSNEVYKDSSNSEYGDQVRNYVNLPRILLILHFQSTASNSPKNLRFQQSQHPATVSWSF